MITSNGNHIVFNSNTHTHKKYHGILYSANDANSNPQSVGYTNDIALSSGMQLAFKSSHIPTKCSYSFWHHIKQLAVNKFYIINISLRR